MKKTAQRGFTLLIAVIFMSVMLAFGLALGSLAYKQQVLASSGVESQYAFYAADAGLECGLYADQQQNLFAYPAVNPGSAPTAQCDNAPAVSASETWSATRWVVFNRFSLDSNTRCVDVTVYKPNPTNVAPAPVNVYIFSQGYDVPCTTVADPSAGARIVSRGINVQYSGTNPVSGSNPPPSPTYATWNSSDKSTNITLSNGNLTATSNGSPGMVRSTVGVSSGKWYWEIANTNGSPGRTAIANSSALLSAGPGTDASGWAYGNGTKINNNTSISYGATYGSGDVIGIALDMDSGTVTFYKNCVSQGVAYSGLTGTMFAALGSNSAAFAITTNFGATPLSCTPPAGYNTGLYQ